MRTVVLEKILESLLDASINQSILKENEPDFDAKAETYILFGCSCWQLPHWKKILMLGGAYASRL